MPGVRIRHATAKSCTFTLVDASRPYGEPIACPRCLQTHAFKTYHFDLDDTGAAIVSPEIVERLKQLPQSGFSVASEVKKPPPQVVGHAAANGRNPRPLIAHRDLKEPV